MSAKVYFISDLHHNHLNMALKRGFPDTYCHDENLITQWNLRVNKKDTVYILGDLTMEKAQYEFLDRLNGYKKVILGNHCKLQHTRKLLEYVNSAGGCHYIRDKKYGRIVLTHIPIHPMELDYANAKGVRIWNIHGHIHEAYKIPDKRYVNVSAEVIDYIPRTLDELLGKEHDNQLRLF